jgi:putative transposase
MRNLKFTEEEIVDIVRECEAGVTVSELSQTYGISNTTCRAWKAKYSGMTAGHIKRLRQLEDENRRLQQLVTNLTLSNE